MVIDFHVVDDFFNYMDGVYSSSECEDEMWNHAMGAIGYGVEEDGTEYAIIKNSWNLDWGLEGFAKLAMSDDHPTKNCGLLTLAAYPVMA